MLSALARLSQPLLAAHGSANIRFLSTSAPSVYDFLVRFHVVDREGKRHIVKGLAGTSVADAMYKSGLFPNFDDFTYGPETKEPDAHVYVSNDFMDSLPHVSEMEQTAIELCADGVRPKCAILSELTGASPYIFLCKIENRFLREFRSSCL
jgi:hypothetical protein